MIDDKKIEEATRDYINKNGYFIKYDEDPCVDIEFAYKEGAKWAISESLKDLWHPISEEPMRHSYILFKTANNNGFETEYIDCSWKTLARCFQITQWLYAEDLLPKEGGECK